MSQSTRPSSGPPADPYLNAPLPQRMARNVPSELLRSFVAIVEAGSMAQATETIFLTQSALSLQMKRLEDVLQQKLFRRDGRRLILTPIGEELVGYARQLLALNDRIMCKLGQDSEPEPITVGMVQDFADTLLPDVLGQFRLAHPRSRLVIQIGGSAELLDLFDRSRLDLVLCLGQHGDRSGATWKVVGHDRMAWIGDPAIAELSEVPLVLLEPPCRFRDAALRALTQERRDYRLVLETPNLPAMRAGVRGGLGVSCRTRRFATAEGLPTITSDALPAVPEIETILVRRNRLGDAANDIGDLLAAAAGA
ncbi:DNA-binding transcriptional LysR family regulator [Acetobacter aceti NBRC 14818]|uniref:LysR family transcriptional regulator n=1 Tax=Acetobacter aceti NBRC 14818 TaxID=887700 RepID=A0AB33IH60_ACEAC|nr:LysR substrate-binding domain-containing protein [Acetobacter aceti]TCS25148.1 DNA-binding transcriptional LysR family regulator [Acetobacter aceti NBRC 14818]BCK75868.1 LysR family transcriptional regulator [Acetobacter aceti NBRC 14818]BCK76358.1 LysR family transcriptional regulator [Acetobacter aceti NBRC 14818]GAN58828.1 transcriptional regulator LysR [Acetobacter aceti NBRC 14818]